MTELPRRLLGRTGFEATILGYGAMELRGAPNGPEITDGEAASILSAVLDAGINLIDTSPDYGRSEDMIGQFIAGRRDEYFLASKCGCVPGAAMGSEHVHTAENIRAGVEASLRRMRTDHLDLVQFHRSLTRAEYEEQGALQELLRLRDEGKVRFIGVSGTLPNLDEQVRTGVFDAFQIPYSALQRDHEDAIHRASEAGAGIIVRGGAARGTPTDWEGRRYYMLPGTAAKDRWEAADLDSILDGMSRMEFTLRFTLSHPDLDTTIVGTKNPAHLHENISAALNGPLDPAVVAEAKRRLDMAGATSAG